MFEIGKFVDARGNKLFARWMSRLNRQAVARVTIALYRIETGNLSNAKGVGGGVFEYRLGIDPGYRI